ncbi:ABC transporter ATP-binding protein [Roseomonas nepalensis]|uniref:ABC transporter ATP-binding protein n=1 Tax=Muricoccus nepalensis TaxID=1854500 RepID=A0A502G934_9PROT|nr:ATP-binding cassette domain-containing protein [Roseomonas nepalensis]TPG58142.1 ABC transporter ATP-binding protein [Roseomonas nepalensis]
MSLILEDVWKSYPMRHGRRDILCGINATIRRGDAVGVLGRNGAGKSTLIRVMAGVEAPTRGRVRREMSISWPLGSGFGVQSSMSGADNARFIARIYGQDVRETLDFVQEFAELGPYFYEPVRTYSAGMMGRLLMGLSFSVKFDCYLVDETLSAGDSRFVERCRRMLEDRLGQASLLMVSHFADHIRQYCRTAVVLRNGLLEFYEDLDEGIAAYQRL